MKKRFFNLARSGTVVLATAAAAFAMAAPQASKSTEKAKGPETKAESAKAQTSAAVQAPAEPKIKVGDMAPDFKLLDQNGKIVQLSDFRGKKNVALGFYVF